MTTAALSQAHFRGRSDTNTVDTAATFIAALDTNWTQQSGTPFRVRFTIQETAGGNPNAHTVKLQSSKNAGTFQDVTTSSTNVIAVSTASTSADETAIAVKQLTGTGTFINGVYDETGGTTTSVDLSANSNTEYEFGIQLVTANVASGDTIALKVVALSGTTITATTSPTITAQVLATPSGVSGTGQAGTVTAQYAGSGTLTGLQAVGFPSPPAIDYNFSSNSIPSGLTFTRSNAGNYFDSTGTLQSASTNTPRFEYDPSTLAWRGLLIEPASTNYVTNPRAEGASGTTFPTTWYQEVWMGGAAATFVTGTENGIPYVDITLNATVTNNNEWWSFGTFGAIAASLGQIWTGSCYVSLSGGSTTNVSGFQFVFQQVDSGTTKLGNLVSSVFPISSGTLATKRVTFTTTLNQASTAKLNFMGRVVFTSTGVPVNLTVRIGGPQAEITDTYTSLMLPPVSSPGTSSRAAEGLLNSSIASWYSDGQSSVACEAMVPYSTVTQSTWPIMWQFDDGSNANRLASYLELGSSLDVKALNARGGSNDLFLDVGNATANTVFRTAYTISSTRAAYTRDGNSVVSGAPTVFPPSGVVDLWLGSAQAASNFLSGYIRRFRYWPHTLPDAYLQFLSAGNLDAKATAQVGGNTSGVSATGSATSLSGGTFSRASSATYIDASGQNMVLVSSDVLRTDYSTATPLNVTSIGSNTGKTVSSIVITLPAAVPAGCTIFVAIATAGSSVLVNIADSVGQTNWVGGNGAATANGTIILDWAWSATAMPASSTITVTKSGGGTFTGAVYAWYVTGLLTSTSPLDTAQTNLGSGTSVTLTTGTLGQVAEYVVGALAVAGPGTETFTNDSNFGVLPSYRVGTTGGSDITVDVGMRLVLSTDAVTYAPTLGTSENWAAYLATFKQTGWGRVLVEAASTNLVPNANTGDPNWNSTISSPPAITPIYSAASLWKLTSPGGSFNYAAFVTIPVTPNQIYTCSAWVYLPVGFSDVPIEIDFDYAAPGGATLPSSSVSTNLSLTGQWQRIWRTVVTAPGTASSMNVVLRPSGSSSAGAIAYFQMFQVEPGTLSSYIPTSGTAATRAADTGSTTGLDILGKIITGAFGTGAAGTPSSWVVPVTAFTRSSPATYVDVNGNLVYVGNTYLRPLYSGTSLIGALLESSSTNGIRNPRAEGAVVGTPGTISTNWDFASNIGLSQQIVSTGTVNGFPFLDIRVFGTTTGQFAGVHFDTQTTIAASNGQTWTRSCYAALVGGSFTNIFQYGLAVYYFNGGGTFLSNNTTAITVTGSLTRFSGTNTISAVGTAFIQPGFYFNTTGASGQAVDFTIRLAVPQLEQASSASSVILPPIGSPAATTRAADSWGGLTGASGTGSAGTETARVSATPSGVAGTGAVGIALGIPQTDATPSIFGVQGYGAPENFVRNPTGTGLVAGTLGSGGSAPTNWSIGGNGLDYDVSVGSTYIVNGVSIPTVRVRLYGTTTSTDASGISYEANQGIAGLTYDVFKTQSIYVAVVAGTPPAPGTLSGLTHWGQILDSTGAIVADQQSAFTPTSTFTQFSQSNTMPSSGNAPFTWRYAAILAYYGVSAGVAVDFTIDMGGGQLAAQTSPIAPSITATETISLTGLTTQSATQTSNAILAPDGNVSGVQLTENTANDDHALNYTFSPTGSTAYTASCYLKQGTRRYAAVEFRVAGAWTNGAAFAVADLQAGTLTNTGGGSSYSITSAGSGWYLVSLTATSIASPPSGLIRLGLSPDGVNLSYTGDGASYAYFWLPSLKTGIGVFGTGSATSLGGGTFSRSSSATYLDLAGNVVSVGNNVLRYQSGVPLIESSVTNNLIRSSQLQTSWGQTAVTVTGNAAIAPDGTLTATLIAETAATAEHFINQTPAILANVPYTISFYAKDITRRYCALQFYDITSPGNTTTAIFDLTAGTVGATSHFGTGNTLWASGIQAIGNGWYRCWVSSTLTTTANTNVLCRLRMMPNTSGTISYTGSASNQIYFWGAQLEQGTSAPTSFIYTISSAATRAADTISTAGIPVVAKSVSGLSGVAAAGSAGITIDCLDPILNLYHNSNNTNRLLADPLSGTSIAVSFTAPHDLILQEVDLFITK